MKSLDEVLLNGTDRERYERHDEIMASIRETIEPYLERDRQRREELRTCRAHNERRKGCLKGE